MNNKIKSYKDLVVWQKSLKLVVEIYSQTNKLSKSEKFGLISQMRRSSVSIPSNIAEGMRRGTNKEFRYFFKNSF